MYIITYTYRARILSVPLGSFAQPRRSQLKKPGWLTLQTERFRKTLCRNYGAIAHKILEHPMCVLSLLMREAELQTSLGNMDSNGGQMATRACTWNPADGEEMSEHLSELFESSSKSKSNILTNNAPRNRAPQKPDGSKHKVQHSSPISSWRLIGPSLSAIPPICHQPDESENRGSAKTNHCPTKEVNVHETGHC